MTQRVKMRLKILVHCDLPKVCGFGLQASTTRSALPTVAHYAGKLNLLADTASRSFVKFHHGNSRGSVSHCDSNFLTSFNAVFPLYEFHQMNSWQLVTPSLEMSSLVTSTLLGTKLPMLRWTGKLAPPAGATGHHGAPGSTSTRSSSELRKNTSPTCSWLSLPESVLELLATANKLGAKASPRPCAMSPKPLFWPATATRNEKSTAQSWD